MAKKQIIEQKCGVCKNWKATGGGAGMCKHPSLDQPYLMISCEGEGCKGFEKVED